MGGKVTEEEINHIKNFEKEIKSLRTKVFKLEEISSTGRLLSGVAHELNNSLTSIMGLTQVALMNNLDISSRKNLEMVLAESKRSAKIVENALALVNKKKTEKKLTNINNLLEKTVNLRAYQFKVNNIESSFDLFPELPPTLIDSKRLQRVFLDILYNCEHSILQTKKEGKISIKTDFQSHKKDLIFINISDNGAGLLPESLKRIFVPSFSSNETIEGLNTAQAIIKEHGGRLIVESQPDKGNSFDIILPRVKDEEGSLIREKRVPFLRKVDVRNVLVVDDEPVIINLIRNILSRKGFVVESACDAHTALEKIWNEEFALIISDIKMPGLDGQWLYEQVKEKDALLARSIIFTTGDTASEKTQEFLESVDNFIISKPFDIETFNKVIEEVAS